MQGIISDLFPGIALPKPDYDSLEEAIREACAAASLQPTEYFMLKVGGEGSCVHVRTEERVLLCRAA